MLAWRKRAMDLTVVETVNTCPLCGGALELVEDGSSIWFGCRRCMRYVKREKRIIMKRFVDYRTRKFDWIGIMAELYQLYTK
jgi:tRNA(Ile2) C34 agmatinyltransferase TiaS